MIKKFIEQNTSAAIRRRARDIIERGLILQFKYDEQKEQIKAVVRGNFPYDVRVWFDNGSVETKCNCPYNWDGLCKHETAVLYKFLEKHQDFHPADISAPKRLTIKDYEMVTIDTLSAYATDDMLSDAARLCEDTILLDFDDKDKSLVFVVEDKYQNWSPEYEVTVKLTKKGLRPTCTCSGTAGGCDHIFAALLFPSFVLENPRLFRFLDKDFRRGYFKETAKNHGIEHADDYDDIADIYVNNGTLVWAFTGKYSGLIPLKEDGIAHVGSHFKEIHEKMTAPEELLPGPVTDKPSPEKGFGIEFIFDETREALIQVRCLTGKLGKNRDKLISNLTYVNLDDYPEADDAQREILILTGQVNKKLSGLKREVKGLSQTIGLLKDLFRKINEDVFVFYQKYSFHFHNFDEKPRKSSLRSAVVSSQPFHVQFRVSADDNLLSIVPEIWVEDQRLDVDPEKFSGYMVDAMVLLHKNTLYIATGLSDVTTVIDLQTWPVKKAGKNLRDDFIKEVVLPHAKIHPVTIDKNTGIESRVIPPKMLKKKVYLSGLGQFVMFRPFVQYDKEVEANILNKGQLSFYENEAVTTIKRDTEYEEEFYELLKSLHPKFTRQYPEEFFHIEIKDMLQDHWFFTAFDKLREAEVEILGLKKLKNFKYNTRRASIQLNVKSGQDWFDVEMEVTFGDMKVCLADVRKAILRRDRFIELSDGSVGILPEEWLEKLGKMFRHGSVEDDHMQIPSTRFMIIDELFDDIDDTEILEALREKKERLGKFKEIKKVRVPAAIRAELRHYQKEGLNWLNFLHEFGWGGILADDMGLGKTLQILAFLSQAKVKKSGPNLIVVPTTLIFNWENEINKFCPSLKVFFHYGNARVKNHEHFKDYDLIITTYGMVTRDIEWLHDFRFNYIILDESQAIKNPQSLRFKSVCLLQGKNRLTLTGTPIENNTFDLFAQMQFVNPGMFPSAKSFKDEFSTPIDKNGDRGRAAELRRLINPFIIRRTKEQVATELPQKTEEVIYCRMDKDQRKVYDAYRNKYRDMLLGRIEEDGIEKSKIYVLEGLMKLRQICDSPLLLPDDEHYGGASVKIDELERNITEKTGNHKIIVFSQFVTMLGLIKNRLDQLGMPYEYLDGSSSQKARKESVNRFQDDDGCRVFLISLKAGGTGLNLTAADYVFIVDPWWNPAVEEQAIDRCYRIGQDKKVFAYRMICKDTIEEKIMNYQQRKRAVAADIIQAEESFMKQLTADDIKGLFS